jgi:hypothetical protein
MAKNLTTAFILVALYLCRPFCLITADAAITIPIGFSSESTIPPSYVPNDSTILSVGMDPTTGQLYASNGYQFSPFNFSGTSGPVESLRPPIGSNDASDDFIFDQSGNLYLSVLWGGLIIQRSPGTQNFITLASGLTFPRNLTFDAQGNLLVIGKASLTDPGTIWKITPSGNISTLAIGVPGPIKLATNRNGKVYILTFSGVIYEVLASGNLSLYTDLASAGIVGDSIGSPESFAIDNSNNMFVSIYEGQRFGTNSSEIYRINTSLKLDLFAVVVGDLPVAMFFTPDNQLILGAYNASTSSTVIKISGDFSAASFNAVVFSGFFSPVHNLPIVNNVKAGQTIPVKWRITDPNGAPISDPANFKNLASSPVSCTSFSGDAASPPIEEHSAGSSGLQYRGDGHWQFNWKTPKAYAGQCRKMVLTLGDGSTHEADFKFKEEKKKERHEDADLLHGLGHDENDERLSR